MHLTCFNCRKDDYDYVPGRRRRRRRTMKVPTHEKAEIPTEKGEDAEKEHPYQKQLQLGGTSEKVAEATLQGRRSDTVDTPGGGFLHGRRQEGAFISGDPSHGRHRRRS